MSLIGYFLLNDILKNNSNDKSPGEILEILHNDVVLMLKKSGNEALTTDGLDIALCKIDTANNDLSFSGARRPLYHQSDDLLTEYKGSRYSIGGVQFKASTKYDTNSIKLKKEDKIFIFTDGYSNQFGGPNNRKFGSKRMKELISANKNEPMANLYQKFQDEYQIWKGSEKQIDDVLLIGIKF
jgi:serine phosphatase RsbU (regulator of sigma subunit)